MPGRHLPRSLSLERLGGGPRVPAHPRASLWRDRGGPNQRQRCTRRPRTRIRSTMTTPHVGQPGSWTPQWQPTRLRLAGASPRCRQHHKERSFALFGHRGAASKTIVVAGEEFTALLLGASTPHKPQCSCRAPPLATWSARERVPTTAVGQPPMVGPPADNAIPADPSTSRPCEV